MSTSNDLPSLERLIRSSHIYAGIGARATPAPVLRLMAKIGSMLADYALILRSGASPGADKAFEQGCDWSHGAKEIFLPWKGFCQHGSPLFVPPGSALALAARVHPNWGRCGSGARHLHARNCQQILGQDLDNPVQFAVFWAREWSGKIEGGTATAVMLARERSIPTYNLRDEATCRLWFEAVARHEEHRNRLWREMLRTLHRESPGAG